MGSGDVGVVHVVEILFLAALYYYNTVSAMDD